MATRSLPIYLAIQLNIPVSDLQTSMLSSLTDYPKVTLSIKDKANLCKVFDWHRTVARHALQHYANANIILVNMLEQCRYLHIPLGNFPDDPVYLHEILLDKLDREQKKQFLNAQDNYQKAVKDSKQSTATNVNPVNITILEDIMKFHAKFTTMVTEAIQEYEDKKYKTEEKIQSHLSFINYPRSQNLMEFDPLVLDCTCEGHDDHDDIQLIWFQNNKQIHQNADIRHEREGNTFKLFVTAVFSDDSGVFSALLKTRNKEALDPGFIQFPQSIRSMKDSKAIFNCKTTGSTPMTAQWNLNGEQLNLESNRFISTNGEREFSLEIPVVLPTDEGQYTLIISNDKGYSTAAFTLHVNQS